MANPVGPSFIPKAVLTAGRVAHQPFEVPTELRNSALLQGGVTHAAIGGINKAAAEAVQALEPRGPAKFLEKIFGRIDSSIVGSAAQAQKATEVFWVPFSEGAHQVGHAIANPFSLFYAKRAGIEMPADPAAAQALLAKITDPNPGSTKFPGRNWPGPGGADAPAEAPAGETKPVEEAPTGEPKPVEEAPTGETKPVEEAPTGEPKPAETPVETQETASPQPSPTPEGTSSAPSPEVAPEG